MVICCAAMSKPAMFLQSELDMYKYHMELNYIGVLKFILPIAKRMSDRRSQGRICLVGDPVASQHAIPGITPYAASKSAVE